jgi:hypothetical protein
MNKKHKKEVVMPDTTDNGRSSGEAPEHLHEPKDCAAGQAPEKELVNEVIDERFDDEPSVHGVIYFPSGKPL